jgi:hypothetical protein
VHAIQNKESGASHVTNKELFQAIMKKKDSVHAIQNKESGASHDMKQRVVPSNYEEKGLGACGSKQRVRCKP